MGQGDRRRAHPGGMRLRASCKSGKSRGSVALLLPSPLWGGVGGGGRHVGHFNAAASRPPTPTLPHKGGGRRSGGAVCTRPRPLTASPSRQLVGWAKAPLRRAHAVHGDRTAWARFALPTLRAIRADRNALSSPNFTLLRAKRLILLWWHDLCSHNILQIDIDMIGAQ